MSPLRLVVFILLSTVVSNASKDQQGSFRFPVKHQITPYFRKETYFKEIGVVPGARTCGGVGKFIRIRHDQCITGGLAPCVLPHNAVGNGEIIFVPSESTTGLVVITRHTTSDGRSTTFENLFPDVTVAAGQEYALTAAGAGTPELKGKHVNAQVEIYRMVDKQVEMCVEMDVVFV